MVMIMVILVMVSEINGLWYVKTTILVFLVFFNENLVVIIGFP